MTDALPFPATRRAFAACLLLVLSVCMANTPAQAESREVTPLTLQADLAAAGPGTILLLAPGDYGVLSMRGGGGSAAAPLILRSADPSDPAILREMVLRDVRHITLDGLLFDHVYEAADPLHFRPYQILASTGVTIRNSLFDGDEARGLSPVDDGFGTAFGLGVRDSRGFTLEGTEIRRFYRGLVVSNTQDVLVRGNDLHDIRMDGMNFSQVEAVVIEANYIHDFNRSLASADHADMIQFWTNGTDSPSRNIIIRNNVLNSGEGWYTQSIFMRNDLVDRGLAGPEMFYRNITIEDNLILNAHLHGITVGETDGLTIQDNTVVRNGRSEGAADNPTLWTPQIRVASDARNVEVLRNVTSKISGFEGQQDWRLDRNLFVQDKGRMEPGYYGEVFVDGAILDPASIASFLPRPGGPLIGANIGATLLRR